MNYTENLKLRKPELKDKVDISDFNNNSDILDDVVGNVKNQVEEQSKLYGGFEEDSKSFNGQMINWNRGNLLHVSGADIIKQEDDVVIIKAFADTQYINIETHLLDSSSHILGLKNYNGSGILSTAGINPDTNKSVELSMTPFTNASNGFVHQVDRYKNRPFPVNRVILAINLSIGEECTITLSDILLSNGDKGSKDDISWNELQVNNFPEHFTNMSLLSKLIGEQSKSNLVLVTTMQKLLSEKIEKLEILAKKQAKQPANLWGGNINNSMYVGAELIGDYYYLKEDHQINNVGITRDTDSSLWTNKPTDGDTIYTHIWISAERDINYVPELHYRNNKYVSEVTGKTIKRGMNHLLFEHELIDTSDLTTTFKTSLLKGIKMYDLVMVTKTKGYFDYIESKVQVDYQEELDFYKSQLEKLKLTQEVDLNLLLTL